MLWSLVITAGLSVILRDFQPAWADVTAADLQKINAMIKDQKEQDAGNPPPNVSAWLTIAKHVQDLQRGKCYSLPFENCEKLEANFNQASDELNKSQWAQKLSEDDPGHAGLVQFQKKASEIVSFVRHHRWEMKQNCDTADQKSIREILDKANVCTGVVDLIMDYNTSFDVEFKSFKDCAEFDQKKFQNKLTHMNIRFSPEMQETIVGVFSQPLRVENLLSDFEGTRVAPSNAGEKPKEMQSGRSALLHYIERRQKQYPNHPMELNWDYFSKCLNKFKMARSSNSKALGVLGVDLDFQWFKYQNYPTPVSILGRETLMLLELLGTKNLRNLKIKVLGKEHLIRLLQLIKDNDVTLDSLTVNLENYPYELTHLIAAMHNGEFAVKSLSLVYPIGDPYGEMYRKLKVFNTVLTALIKDPQIHLEELVLLLRGQSLETAEKVGLALKTNSTLKKIRMVVSEGENVDFSPIIDHLSGNHSIQSAELEAHSEVKRSNVLETLDTLRHILVSNKTLKTFRLKVNLPPVDKSKVDEKDSKFDLHIENGQLMGARVEDFPTEFRVTIDDILSKLKQNANVTEQKSVETQKQKIREPEERKTE